MTQVRHLLLAVLRDQVVRLIARVVIGGLFVTTGIEKILDPYGFMAAIGEYGLISGNALLVTAVVFPWLEAVFGAALLLGVFPKTSSLVVSGLVLVFIAAMFLSWGETLSAGCGCFPGEDEAVTVGWALVSRDIGILLVSIYTWAFPSRWFALYPGNYSAEPEAQCRLP
jgi:uncharacterized membrane protein YphA (DoxX/SURF4 family)